MVRGIATKPARIGSDKIYLTKARDFLNSAIIETEKENWNSATVLSIHSVISACDAICARFLQITSWWSGSYAGSRTSGQSPFLRI